MATPLIDIHTHLYPEAYRDALRARREPPRLVPAADGERFVIFPGEAGRPMGAEYTDVGLKLAFMDATGIDQSLVSLGNPWLDPIPDSIDLARELNAELAALRDATGARIVGMGVLPGGDVAAAGEVAAEIAATDGLHGVATGLRICGLELDDERLDPLWAVLERTALPVFLHPHDGVGTTAMLGYAHALPVALAFPFETTTAVARLIFGGVYERFPGLKLVAAHGGGTLPFLAGRLDAAWRSAPTTHERLPVPPSERLANLFLDALTYHPRAMRATAELVGTGRMAFGTDHPFTVADPEANLRGIRAAFDGAERDAVLHGSARAYFNLPALAPAPSDGGR